MAQQEKVKFWQVAEFDQLELLHATYVTHAFAKHIHEGYALGVIEHGAEAFYYRGETHHAPERCIVVINPGEIHTGQAAARAGSWTYRMLYPGVTIMRHIARGVTGKPWDMPYFSQPVISDPELAKTLQQMHKVLEHSPSQLERESWLWLGLGKLILHHAVNQRTPLMTRAEHAAVERTRRYLEEHYAQNVTLNDLAAQAAFSPYHFLRLFHQQIGVPPHVYLTHIRLQWAKALLNNGESIAQTALAVGFADQSHFTKNFRRVYGITPGTFVAGLARTR